MEVENCPYIGSLQPFSIAIDKVIQVSENFGVKVLQTGDLNN